MKSSQSSIPLRPAEPGRTIRPRSVTEAIDSLEFAGDANVVPQLQRLLAHTDARVRKSAADAIRLLGD